MVLDVRFSAAYLPTLAFCSGVMITYGSRHRFPPLLFLDASTSLFASLIEVAGTFLLSGPEGSGKLPPFAFVRLKHLNKVDINAIGCKYSHVLIRQYFGTYNPRNHHFSSGIPGEKN